MGGRNLGVGKLPMDLLQTLLERYTGQDERLVVGPRVWCFCIGQVPLERLYYAVF